MNIILRVKEKIKNRIANLVNAEVQKTMEYVLPQLLEFQTSAKEDKQSYHDHTKQPFGNMSIYTGLRNRLLSIGIPVEEVDIDIPDFERWLGEFPALYKYYQSLGEVHIEKCLEHYLAFRHLNILKDDIYIDIAALGSPWANNLRHKGITSYRLDLVYLAGIHGINIGADAGNTKLPGAFATALSSQCAYECFMGDADIRFVKEAERILNGKGRFCIVPLYLDDTYFVATSPYCDQREVEIEHEAKRVWRDDEFKVPFSRHYSPDIFKSRIYSAIPDNMTGKVLYFRNLANVMKHFEGQKIYCFFMFYCEKNHTVSI